MELWPSCFCLLPPQAWPWLGDSIVDACLPGNYLNLVFNGPVCIQPRNSIPGWCLVQGSALITAATARTCALTHILSSDPSSSVCGGEAGAQLLEPVGYTVTYVWSCS